MSEYVTRRRTVAALVLMAALVWLLWPYSQLVRVQEISRSVGNTAQFITTMYDLQSKVADAYSKPLNA